MGVFIPPINTAVLTSTAGWIFIYELNGLLFYLILLVFPSYRKSLHQSQNKFFFVIRSLIFYCIGCALTLSLITILILVIIAQSGRPLM